jgi:hypothetical protein
MAAKEPENKHKKRRISRSRSRSPVQSAAAAAPRAAANEGSFWLPYCANEEDPLTLQRWDEIGAANRVIEIDTMGMGALPIRHCFLREELIKSIEHKQNQSYLWITPDARSLVYKFPYGEWVLDFRGDVLAALRPPTTALLQLEPLKTRYRVGLTPAKAEDVTVFKLVFDMRSDYERRHQLTNARFQAAMKSPSLEIRLAALADMVLKVREHNFQLEYRKMSQVRSMIPPYLLDVLAKIPAEKQKTLLLSPVNVQISYLQKYQAYLHSLAYSGRPFVAASSANAAAAAAAPAAAAAAAASPPRRRRSGPRGRRSSSPPSMPALPPLRF